ncbi:MAG: 3-hydroxyacyl-CoA dehydrogenase [Rickettsiaceae bacterium]|jgi:3-hydroxyacyl-CoA dehydrogenase/enoyl-CoA hydratase/3-hydroxybutyryl-CoA epimerase|nr:3-hydroxyacyl-CoA dehydrogenase [Rickettsiaceae bacterium]
MSKSLVLSLDTNGVATLAFNLENEKVNKLSAEVLLELEKVLDEVEENRNIHLLLIKSDKPNIFIAGADIKEIKGIRNESDAYKKVLQGQEILSKIADLKIPTIALINGACLGGGLELALACTYRVAVDNKKTELGLPEVNLGIIPGFGGTQRLPRLLGLSESLKMILSGKAVDYKKAFKIGLVDKVIREEFLENDLSDFIAHVLVNRYENQALKRRRAIRKRRFMQEVVMAGKYLIYYFVNRDLMKKTKGKYPAPLVAFDVIKRTYHCADHQASFKIEAEEFSKLASGEVAKNLIEIFFISEEIKKDQGVDEETKTKEIKQVGLMGAGIMGGGIAWLFSNRDIQVRMKDISQFGIAIGFNQVLKIYKQLKKIGKYNDNQISLKMDEISSTTDYSGFNNVDLVVEAIVENIDVKKSSFAELEANVRGDTIIVSNTSSLSITEMATALKKPERFAGMHFFNPVNKMPLVEVIKGQKTSDETVATIVNLSKKLGKTPIVVKDVAGFLVNRILLPYINEAGFLLQEGADLKTIDNVIEDFGMPMGPFVLADTVGIDVGYKVAKSLHEGYGERMAICHLLVEMSKNKELLGKKSKQGFYKYSKDGKKLGINSEVIHILQKVRNSNQIHKSYISNHDIIDRCIFIMINEAAKCLEENVVKNHRYLDMAMIMGTGFPAFRGGILRYADNVGISVVVSRLKEFSKVYGPRFEPANLLVKMDHDNQNFYGLN